MCTEFEVTAVLRDEVYAETELGKEFQEQPACECKSVSSCLLSWICGS